MVWPWSAAPPPDYDPTASPQDQGPSPYDPAAAYRHPHPGRPGMPYNPASLPPTKTKFSRWAIATFVFGLLSIFVVSILCGIVALGRIKMFGQRGRRLAIAGLAVSGVWIAAGILVLVLVNFSRATQTPTGEITHSGHLSVWSLSVGNCFDNPPGATRVGSVTATLCSQAHNAQVFAKFNLAGSGDIYSGTPGTYPGSAAVTRLAADGCNLRLGALDKSKITDSMTIRFLYPSEQTWLNGHHAVTCMIDNSAANLTFSVLSTEAPGIQ